MFARYLVLPSLLLELALALPANNSSIPESNSTIEITSFSTLTITAGTNNGGSPQTNGSGLAYALSCNQAKLDWVENSGQAYVSNTTFRTSTDVGSYSRIRSGWIETIGPTEVYTLCDGYPRMNASTEYKTIDTVSEWTIWSTITTETEVYRNVSAPTCTIGPQDCSALNSSYSESLVAYSKYLSQTSSGYTGQTTWPSVTSPEFPICGSATLPPIRTLINPACVYNHATIQLLYWPVSTAGNHICGDDWTTVEATPTIEGQPNTAVGFNTTFTSPTVYMVMSGAYSVGSNYETGTAINGILPMASDAVSSMCAYQGGEMGPPEPMDYADFDAPIPKSKYLCQPACWTKPDYPQSWTNSAYNLTATENLCSTIYDGVYKPALQVPIDEFNSFYANFTNGVGLDFGSNKCSFSPGTDGIFYDPPSALQQVQSAVGPSVPNSPGATTTAKENPQTTPAAPAPTIPTALPQTTGGRNDVPQPTQPSTPDPSGDDSEDDSSDPDSPSDPENDEDNNNNNSGGGGNNSDDSDDGGNNNVNPDSPFNPTPTQNVAGIIASIIGANPAPVAQSLAPQDSSGPSDPSTEPSNPSSNDDPAPAPSQPDPQQGQSDAQQEDRPILLTDDSGATLTVTRSGANIILLSATFTSGQETSLPGIGSLSFGSGGVVQNGQTIAYPTAAPSSGDEGYVVDGQTYNVDASSNVVVAPGVTLTAGGSAATVSGTTYVLGGGSNSGDRLTVNGVAATRTDLGSGRGGSGSMSSGVPQQTGNTAPGLLVGGGGVHLVAVVGLLIFAGFA